MSTHRHHQPRHDPAQRQAASGLTRRRLLGTGVAAGLLPGMARAAATAPMPLIADTRTLEVNGRAAKVFGLVDGQGRPGLRLDPGAPFRVILRNNTGAHTLVHWHGQLPPWRQDGFPWPQTPPIANGTTQSYDYQPIAGTYWMHSHHGLQEQALLTAPLIVRDAATQREDRQEVVLMLHDFTFRSPAEVLAGLTGGDTSAAMAMDAPDPIANPAPHGAAMADRPAMAMPGMSMPGMQPHAMGQHATAPHEMASDAVAMPATRGTGMAMDLNDVQYDAFLANDRTLADPEIVPVERHGRVRLRVINGAAASQFWLDLGMLTGRVVATDGHAALAVPGRRFPLAIAQRLDIELDLPSHGAFPILAQLEGTTRRTGIVLANPGAAIPRLGDAGQAAPPVDMSLETRLRAAIPLPRRVPDLTRQIILDGSMQPYAWSMNGQFWPHITPLTLRQGQRVEIELVNHSMMAHPIHLHGHAFQVIAIAGQPVQGALRDTVLVMPMQTLRFAFDANNPGRWAFHCHNLYHMATGMMTEVRYDGITI